MVYIGQTILSLKQRKSNHMKSIRAGSTTYFHNALRKGKFDWDIVCEVANKTCLDNYEVYYIQEFGSQWPGGYNLTSGGGTFTFNDEVKQRMSDAHKDVPLSEEHKKSISKSLIGNTRSLGVYPSDETKQKMSDAKLGDKNHFYGKTHTAKVKEQCRAAQLGHKDSAETKRKKSEAIKLWWANRKEKRI